MVSIAQPKQADSTQSRSFIPTGVDCGAGLVKVCVDSNGSQMRLRQPSKVLELKTALIDDLVSKEGGHFFYHSGDRIDLINREFLTGELAAWKAPTTHIKLSDDPVLKAEYCLHSILGALAALPHRQEWNLFVVISTHSRDLFNAKLKELTNGVHIVSFNGKNKPQSRVSITVGSVAPEGAGSYTYAKRLNIIDPAAHTIGLDFGTSTVIPQVFAPGGKLIYHQPLEVGGCIDLLEAIASDSELIQFLGTGKAGNIELIRKGIETGEFNYGSRNFVFRPIYARLVKTWLADRLRLALKSTEEWRDAAQSLVAWGGGTQMAGVSRMLGTQGISTVPDGTWANSIGLQTVSTALLARRV
ncbi:MAG: hypothetical protein ICV55_07390 [Coleofasciculus sp. C3-bin4]|nr:hypothetical protein [Coleofasciculus sp. Co-bin14]MBD0362581.1 hypothetical protein [Coleofasciculus sp. C3-bin4]